MEKSIDKIFVLYADELDSYMYQTVGHQGIEKIAEAMELPLYRKETEGKESCRLNVQTCFKFCK